MKSIPLQKKVDKCKNISVCIQVYLCRRINSTHNIIFCKHRVCFHVVSPHCFNHHIAVQQQPHRKYSNKYISQHNPNSVKKHGELYSSLSAISWNFIFCLDASIGSINITVYISIECYYIQCSKNTSSPPSIVRPLSAKENCVKYLSSGGNFCDGIDRFPNPKSDTHQARTSNSAAYFGSFNFSLCTTFPKSKNSHTLPPA